VGAAGAFRSRRAAINLVRKTAASAVDVRESRWNVRKVRSPSLCQHDSPPTRRLEQPATQCHPTLGFRKEWSVLDKNPVVPF
jgi:hypothetical protein